MAVEYSLQITQIDLIPELDEKQDVVFRIYWAYTATDGDKKAGFGNSTELTYEGGDFIPYGSLTEEQVKAWVMASMTDDQISAMQQTLQNELSVSKAAPPWAPVANDDVPASGLTDG